MNLRQTPTAMTNRHARSNAGPTRLHGTWLHLVRLSWGVLVALNLGVFVASLPVYVALLQSICSGPVVGCAAGELAPATVRALQAVGISLGAYVAIKLVLDGVMALVCLAVSAVLFWRKSEDWIALLVAFFLVLLGTATVINTVAQSPSVWQVPAQVSIALFYVLLFLLFYVFPDGYFVPPWTRWLLVGWIINVLLYVFWPSAFATSSWLKALSLLWTAPFYLSLVLAVVYRYRHASGPLQRQQTKWVVFGIMLALIGFFGAILWDNLVFFPTSELIADTATAVALLLIPLSFGLAILRYRLWDIDVLINRTLVYGSLTSILTLSYVGLILLLQAFTHALTGQAGDHPVLIVISTLAIVGLFQPLRRRIQRIIDRRFYRSKYDAARTVAAFSSTLRQEVDLEQLREQLLAVVQETMQPAHVSLWLRPPERDGKRKPWRANPLSPYHTDE